MTQPVRAPSDLTARGRRSGRRGQIRVGGRVIFAEGRVARLADALGALEVVLSEPSLVSPGDLIVVQGRLARGRLHGHLVARYPQPEPTAQSEASRLIFEGVGPRLAARAQAFAVIRGYFGGQGFREVDTPQRVRMPGLDLHVDALGAEGGTLVTSPEHQMKRLLAGGLPRIYQLAHCWRAGERGPWHEPEFMMLEWYRAFAGAREVMRDTEQVVERVVTAIAGRPVVAFPDGTRVSVRAPFERVTVRAAFRRHAGIADAAELAQDDPDAFFEALVGRVEPALARRRRAVFLTEYPISQASLARAVPGDPTVAERFELYVGGVELCNGFGELTDPVEQRRRFRSDQRQRRAARRPVYPLDERLLAALEEGLPPAGGNALGVDRLVALACGVAEIQAVQAFPEAWL